MRKPEDIAPTPASAAKPNRAQRRQAEREKGSASRGHLLARLLKPTEQDVSAARAVAIALSSKAMVMVGGGFRPGRATAIAAELELRRIAANHQHREAFCLMKYRCQPDHHHQRPSCGHQEIVWNSRDGVTPFGGCCPSCGGTQWLHVDFAGDVYAPDHQLHRGQKFWRNGTLDEWRAAFAQLVATWPEGWDADKPAGWRHAHVAQSAKEAFEKRQPWLDVRTPV